MVASLDSYSGHVAYSSQGHCVQGVDGCSLIQLAWQVPGASLLCAWWGRAHVSIHGSFISSLRAFTVKADVDRRLARKRDCGTSVFETGGFCFAVHSVSPAVGRCLPSCKFRRALPPCTKTFSTTTTSSAAVLTSIPRLCLCGGASSSVAVRSSPAKVC